jgi:hypothetical protein
MRDIDLVFQKTLTKIGLLDRPILNEAANNRKRVGVTIRNGDPLVFEKETDNLIFLESGEHGGATINENGMTVIIGASGATFTGHINITGRSTVIFNNCHFKQTKQNTDRFVTIEGGLARVVFNNCSFRRYPTTMKDIVGIPVATAAYVSIDTPVAGPTDQVNFVSCIFEEQGFSGIVSGNMINNLDPVGVGSGDAAYCINRTGLAFGIPNIGTLT